MTKDEMIEKLRISIEDFHRSECGCLDWRRDAQCMTLYKIIALSLTSTAPVLSDEEREAMVAVDDLSDGSKHDWRRFSHVLAAAVRRLTGDPK